MIKKIIKWTCFLLAGILVLLIAASIIISSIFENKINGYLKNYLDAHLLTEISMTDMKFRLFKGFPNGTIEISDAVILSGRNFSPADFSDSFADTLLYANKLFLQFDLMRMIKKDYVLKKIEISKGTLNVLYDKKKHHNLDIWKSSGDSSAYSVQLKSLLLRDCKIQIQYLSEAFVLKGFSNRMHFKGDLTNGILSGQLKGNPYLKSVRSKDRLLANQVRLDLDMNLIYSKEKLDISDCKFRYNKASGTLDLNLENVPTQSIDLTIHMPSAGLDEIMSAIPGSTPLHTGKYSFSGKGKFFIVVKGSLTNRNHLLVKSGFELTRCAIKNNHSRVALTDINLKGTVSGTQRNNFRLELDSVYARLGKGSLHGVFSLNNLDAQNFRSRIVADLDLKAVKEFIQLDSINELKGNLISDITISGSLKDFSDSTLRKLHMIEQGSFTFKDASVSFKNIPVQIDGINGKAKWSESVTIDSLSLRLNETEILADGTITNLNAYLNRNGNLKANLNLSTDILNISKYLNNPSSSKSGSGYKSLSIIPPGISITAKLTANQFIAENFEAQNCLLNLSSIRDSLYVRSFYLKFPDGSIQGNGLLTINPGHIIAFACNAKPSKINIQQLFYAFNNFSQKFILDKNLKGLLDGNIQFYAQWDSTLKLIPASMNVQGDFRISNGELVQFDPMLKLSKYINVEELRHIRFKTLVNTISISNRAISIPEMDINSTAFNIKVSGTHNFDNHFEYHLRVLLSEVLFNKARKKKKDFDEFLVEDNKSEQAAIPLLFSGTPDNNTVKLDKRKVLNLGRNKSKEDLPEKKSNPGEFTFEDEASEKPAASTKNETKNNASDFDIEWEDE